MTVTVTVAAKAAAERRNERSRQSQHYKQSERGFVIPASHWLFPNATVRL